MPKFSVIVPVYNVEREYLEAALNSMLAQTFTDWECICVDDGSTNDSGKVLDDFAAKDPRFKVHHRTNQGVGAARNFALSQACGEWIMFLDGDDLYTPAALATVNQLIEKYPNSKIARFWFEYIEEHELWHAKEEVAVDGLFNLREVFPKSLISTPLWGFAFNKNAIAHVRFTDLTMGEDILFSLECLIDKPNYAYSSKKLYGYRQRQTSVCHQATAKGLFDNLRFHIERFKMFEHDTRKNYFSQTPGITRFLVHDFVVHTSRFKSRDDRNILWNAWFESLDFLATRREFGEPYHSIFSICRATRSRLISYLICGVCLAVAWRIRLPWAKILNPKSDDDLKRLFIALDGVSIPGVV